MILVILAAVVLVAAGLFIGDARDPHRGTWKR